MIETHQPSQDADCRVRVDLGEHGMPGRFEELWARKRAPDVFQVLSLPFFPYGIRRLDHVRTNDDFLVVGVVERGGRSLLRVAGARETDGLFVPAREILADLDLHHEWFNSRYVVVDLPDESLPKALLDWCQPLVDREMAWWEFA